MPAGSDLRQEFPLSIAINGNDTKNEPTEIFLIKVELSGATASNPKAPIVNFLNDGLTLGVIVDDDGQSN